MYVWSIHIIDALGDLEMLELLKDSLAAPVLRTQV